MNRGSSRDPECSTGKGPARIIRDVGPAYTRAYDNDTFVRNVYSGSPCAIPGRYRDGVARVRRIDGALDSRRRAIERRMGRCASQLAKHARTEQN